MAAPDCPITRECWDEQVRRLKASSNAVLESCTGKLVEDAGPWASAVREILSCRDLSENWDYYGAQPPSRDVLESAIALAYAYEKSGVQPPHRVAPGVAGDVTFEWQHPDGTFAEVEINARLYAEIMVVEPGKPARHATVGND